MQGSPTAALWMLSMATFMGHHSPNCLLLGQIVEHVRLIDQKIFTDLDVEHANINIYSVASSMWPDYFTLLAFNPASP